MGFYITVPGNIGDYIHIGPHVTIIGGKTGVFVMENFTTIAAGSRIVCSGDDHRGMGLVGPTIPGEYRDKITNAPVIFKRFASIGTNVVVHQGVTLGEGSVVGSCSLVTKDTQPWTIYAGVPAKPIKDRRSDLMMEYARKLGYL
jgi:galactoside O-acetyltransferase